MVNASHLKNRYAEDFLEKVFYFCIKKTGNITEAEDLSSDISLSVFTQLEKGNLPVAFDAWVWKIARNRYSRWAKLKHERSDSVSGADIDDFAIADEGSVEEEYFLKEDIALLRRELAFISRDYREIVVNFYINDMKTKDIADQLGIPESTVRSRLMRARKILKEGINMAREFGTRSYRPEDIIFAASGNQPSGLPWSAVQRSIPKNILLEANNNPSTAEELAVALGISLPYMEEEIELLIKATLLKRVGEKYITNFFILSRECQLEIYGAQRKNSEERSKLIDSIASDLLDSIRALGIVKNSMSDNELKWWAVIYLNDFLIENTEKYDIEFPVKRSGNETWGFVGYEKTDLPEKTVMGHNGCGGYSKAMLWAYKISDYGLWDRVGELNYIEALLLGEIICQNRNISTLTESERLLWKEIDGRFAHADENGNIIPDVLVIDNESRKKISELFKNHPLYREALAMYGDTLDDTCEILKKYNSPYIADQFIYCASMEVLRTRMMTIHDEVNARRLTVPEDPCRSRIAYALHIME
ncbi:MAG: sigma-70 family RNA polymerase sigma factor [Clostridia bacterium]|nr:sigma-70 family RNA polymerase sigma factor [Clostridia bacterium]